MSAAPTLRDIAGRDDIDALVAAFYRRAFADENLGPIFIEVARVDLSVHLPVMGDFWETVLLRAGRYHCNALRPHVALAAEVELTDAHFARWLELWTATVDERHAGHSRQFPRITRPVAYRVTIYMRSPSPEMRCVVLDNRERQFLLEIERRLLIEDPALVRSFGAPRQRRAAEHDQGLDMITTLAGLTLCVVLLMGPRLLTEVEIATRRSAGPPRVAAETAR